MIGRGCGICGKVVEVVGHSCGIVVKRLRLLIVVVVLVVKASDVGCCGDF